jgi:hypothetical protein
MLHHHHTFWNYAAVDAIERAASDAGLSEEAYIAMATLEKLRRDGYLDDMFYNELVRVVKSGGYGPKG